MILLPKFGILLTFLVAIVTAIPSQPAYAQKRPVVQWNLQTWPRAEIYRVGIEEFVKSVNQLSDDKFHISITYDWAVPPNESIEALKYGAFEMGTICSVFHPNKTPALSVLDLPMLPIENVEHGKRIHNRLFEHREFRTEMERWNAIPVFSELLPQKELFGIGTPPTFPNDWENMKVIVHTGLERELFDRIGASVVPAPYGETYSALVQGTVDATLAYPIKSLWLTDQLQNRGITWFTHGMHAGALNCIVAANKNAYRRLAPFLQEAIRDAVPRAYAEMQEKYDTGVVETNQNITKVDIEDHMIADIRSEYAQPIWNAWAYRVEEWGVDGHEVLAYLMRVAGDVAEN